MTNQIKSICLTILGNIIMSIGVGLFILPYDIITGGIAGIAVILKPFLPIPEDITLTLLAIIMYIIGTIFLGKKFALHTAISTIVYPLSIIVINRCFSPVETDRILASLYGGLIAGAGMGLVFRQGGSTGGIDVPPLIANKYTGIELSKAILITDAVTVTLGVLVYGTDAILVGLISVFTTSIGVSKIVSFGGIKAKKIEVFSNKIEEISQEIQGALDRGATIIDVEGGYKKDKRKVLMVVVYERQFQKAIEIIEKHDESAFVIVSDVHDVRGEGFSYEATL